MWSAGVELYVFVREGCSWIHNVLLTWRRYGVCIHPLSTPRATLSARNSAES
jgi:hypothetical protein